MAITRVWIEKGCVSCGLSESTCPEVFKVKAEGSTVVIKGVDYSGLEKKSSWPPICVPLQSLNMMKMMMYWLRCLHMMMVPVTKQLKFNKIRREGSFVSGFK